MEISAVHPEFLDVFLNSAMFFPYLTQIPENYVHWRETPESHIYSAVIPGVRKEEIKVEVEDSRYLIIRTEATDQSAAPARLFTRKFRLPGRVYTDGISAGYENGVLTVTVPRFRRPGFYIDPSDLSHNLELTARAA